MHVTFFSPNVQNKVHRNGMLSSIVCRFMFCHDIYLEKFDSVEFDFIVMKKMKSTDYSKLVN